MLTKLHCAQCHNTAKDCECSEGFVERLMAKTTRDMSICLCGNGVPSGTWVERKVGGLWDGEATTKRRFVPWSHVGMCLPCLIESRRIASSAERSKALSQALFTEAYGNPWADMERLMFQAARNIVSLIKLVHPRSRCYWAYLGDIVLPPEPVKLDIVYRVNHPLPSLPVMDYNPALDRPNESPSDAIGSWTRHNAHNIGTKGL